MASRVLVRPPAFRSVGRSLLLTLPMALWSLLMFTPSFMHNGRDSHIGAAAVIVFMTTLFFLMMRTGKTYRWRRWFFVALGFLFPVGFIAALIALRGTMSIPIERMVSGDTPFCYMVIPMLVVPAALTRAVVFPGSILPTANNPHSIAVMIGIWLGNDSGRGQGVVQLHLLLRRHRRGFCGDCQTSEDSASRFPAAAGAVGDSDLRCRAFRCAV